MYVVVKEEPDFREKNVGRSILYPKIASNHVKNELLLKMAF